MNDIGRRTFVRGAAAGALAFTVGGVEVLLLPSEARAQKVPLKVLSADEAQPAGSRQRDAGARARAKPASRISSISNARCRRTRRC